MPLQLVAEAPPITADESGALRVGGTRLLVDLVIRAHQSGVAPEEIAQRYSAVSVAEIYGVIGYYLRHRAELDEYLLRRDTAAIQVRTDIEDEIGGQSGLKQSLCARQADSAVVNPS